MEVYVLNHVVIDPMVVTLAYFPRLVYAYKERTYLSSPKMLASTNDMLP